MVDRVRVIIRSGLYRLFFRTMSIPAGVIRGRDGGAARPQPWEKIIESFWETRLFRSGPLLYKRFYNAVVISRIFL